VASLTLKGIVKTYAPGLEPTVKGVDLEIEEGEFFILLGPSGCGKSTLLRMIAGLEEITGGELFIGERLVNRIAAKDRDIAMVFQSYALYPHMTVRENLAFGLKMQRMPAGEIAERIEDAAQVLGLDELLARLPKELSGGQRQRVALGRAMVREPKVFLLDEPLSNLDAKLRGAMRIELKRLHQRLASTMVYVTHDQVEAMTLGDRVAVMHGGRLQQVGPPLEVYDQPANRFVAGFLGSPPMNFLAGRYVQADPALELDGGGRLPLPERLAAVAADGATIEAGVRPEDVRVEPADGADGEGLTGTVAVIEPLGAETILTVDTSAGTVVARTLPGFKPETGGAVRLVPDGERVHLFRPATEGGERVGAPPPPHEDPARGAPAAVVSEGASEPEDEPAAAGDGGPA